MSSMLTAGSAPPLPQSPARPESLVIKRDGRAVPYDRSRITHAVEMAFRAESGVPYPDALDVATHERVETIAEHVEQQVFTDANGPIGI